VKNTSLLSVSTDRSTMRWIKIILILVPLFNIGLMQLQSQTVTDINGNIYNTVTIGTQVWMKENLKTSNYSNGDLIGTTTPASLDVSGESTPKYQWAYNGEESTVATYGRLYTWYAITDSRNVCPAGWHVPADGEWTTLTDYLTNNGYGYEGSGSDVAKSMAATSGWTTDPTVGNVGNDQASNNSSGFTAISSGYRDYYGVFSFNGNNTGYWWSSTAYSSANAYYRTISYMNADVFRFGTYKKLAYSVRCLKDLTTGIKSSGTSVVEIYPNPVSGILNIVYKSENFETISIFNSQGLLLTKNKAIAQLQQIDFSKYPSGLYFIEFVKSSGEIKRFKVVHH
jgi:uncharacterized protein (TIGR02145 family)